MKYIKVSTVTLLILIVLIETSLISQALINSQSKTSAKATEVSSTEAASSPTTDSINDLSTPPPLPQVVFNEVAPSDPDAIMNMSDLLYVNLEPIQSKLPGHEWMTVSTDFTTYTKVASHYDSFLKKNGWSYKTTYQNRKIDAVSASGPRGDTEGYIKIAGDKFRVFVRERNIFNGEGESATRYEIRIFISDILSTSELEK